MLIVCFFFKVLGDCLLGWGGLTNKQPISLSNLTNNYRAPTSCEASPITTTRPQLRLFVCLFVRMGRPNKQTNKQVTTYHTNEGGRNEGTK